MQLGDDRAVTWVFKGRALRGLQRHDEALATLRRAVEINPAGADGWYWLMLTHVSLRHYWSAWAIFWHIFPELIKLLPRAIKEYLTSRFSSLASNGNQRSPEEEHQERITAK